ncbi:MAG: 23S rRNA (pseudouridine(1915)-N(3))-methyltransferase RlmH [Flavobacteriales bacterium]
MKILQVGKTKERFAEEALVHYQKRIRKYVRLEFITVPAAKGKGSIESIKREETKGIRQKLSKNPMLVLLDENGTGMDSGSFARKLNSLMEHGGKELTFIIGGAYGLSDDLKREAQLLLALSEMTFSHRLARIVLLEQLYRGLSIIHGAPYHKE